MADDEIKANLQIDLSEVARKFQELDQRGTATEGKVSRSMKSIGDLEGKSSALEGTIGRIENKLHHAAKQLFRFGATSALSETLGSIAGEDNPAVGLLGSIATGAAFGGAPGAALSGVLFTVSHLEHQVMEIARGYIEQGRRMAEIEKRDAKREEELEALLSGREARLKEQFDRRIEELQATNYDELNELLFQNARALTN